MKGHKVGYAWFFEHSVIYGDFSDVLTVFGKKSKKRIRGKHGAFLGVVKGVIPVDESRILYQFHTQTDKFIERQKIRAFQRKRGIKRHELDPIKKGEV